MFLVVESRAPQRTTKPFWNAGGSPPLFFHPQRSIKAQQNGSNSPETARGVQMGRVAESVGRRERNPNGLCSLTEY